MCALNMEAMTVFRSRGNGLAPANLENVASDAEQEEPEVVGSDTDLTTHLPPSHLALITHHHGTRPTFLSHSAHPQQTTQSTAHPALPHTLSSSHHTTSAIATSSIQVQTSQAKTKSLAALRGSVGVASHRWCFQTRPAVMVERYNLG